MRLKEMVMILSAVTVFSVFAQQKQVTFRTTDDAVRYYEELVGTLTQQVRSMQDENAKLAGSVYDLQNRIRTLEQNIQSLRNEMQGMKQQSESDRAERAHQFDQLADKVQKAASSGSVSRERPVAPAASAAAEEYDTYVVQQGATLSLISRATGAPVAEIRRINHLKNDIIYQGQKLKIPRRNNK